MGYLLFQFTQSFFSLTVTALTGRLLLWLLFHYVDCTSFIQCYIVSDNMKL